MASPLPNISQTFRNIRRAQEIVTVFARYGFTDVLQDVGLDRLFAASKRFVGLAKPDERFVREPQAVRLRKAMESLGPTFIKMAQILSTRPDLIPKDWAEEFARLQSDVPAASAEEMRTHLAGLYDEPLDELFESIEYESFAAASIGQAHRAVLKDGTPVILKVLRPGIRSVIDSDMEILETVVEWVGDRFESVGYSPRAVVDQFQRQLKRETDLQLEGRSTDRMAREFEDNPRVDFPTIHWSHTRRGVLCMEQIDGVLLSKRAEAEFTDQERRDIVAHGTDAVFHQCFEAGFFHADPHPGNIIVRGRGESLTVCFIDCGMTGHLEPRASAQLADLVHSTVNGDLAQVLDVVIDLTGASPGMDRDRVFRADVWEFISKFESATLSQLHMGALLSEFFEKLRRHRLECPADIVFLVKAITTIEGVGEAIAPEFDVVDHVRPHIEGLVRRRYGIGALRRRMERSSLAYAELLEAIPREARTIGHLLRKERFEVDLNHSGLDKLVREVERASRNISAALVISALLVAGSIMFLAASISGGDVLLLKLGGVACVGVAAILSIARVLAAGRIGL